MDLSIKSSSQFLLDEEVDAEMEPINSPVDVIVLPNADIPKGLSMTSVLAPSIQLSWHSITAKPRRESGIIPFLRAINSSSSMTNGFKSPHEKYIIDNVYGVGYPGEVLAIIGGSGTGKTTLLNILTQRNLSTVNASGYIRLNGYEVDKEVIRKISAYVQQEYMFIGTMTVVEHLRFMAVLRMGKYYSARERERRVQSVMSELGLKGCANTMIGWPHQGIKGISGGERKRLAFASEVMTSPPILFCDEPTTGLDSYLAQQVIQVLKDLARRKNMTIIVTIHQPSSQVFEMFDKICLMAAGHLAFFGTIDQAIHFFGQQGYPLPENFNPADHFIHTVSTHDSLKGPRAKSKAKKICDAFFNSDVGRQVYTESRAESSSSGETESSSTSNPRMNDGLWISSKRSYLSSYKASWFQQFWEITKRSFNVTLREPMLLKVRTFQIILIGILLGTIYFDTSIRQSTVMNINGLIFQVVGSMNFIFQFAAVHIFCDQLPIFMSEHHANLYRVDAFFLALNIAELPQYLAYPIIFSTIVYWMSGLVRTFSAYMVFVLNCVLTANIAISIAYAFSCIFGSVNVATAILPILVIPLLAFAGFYINASTLPVYFRPLRYISYFGYAYEIGTINQWSRIDEIPGCGFTNATSVDQANANISISSWKCYEDGMDVLSSLSFQPQNILFDILSILFMIIVFRFIAFLALLIRASTKK